MAKLGLKCWCYCETWDCKLTVGRFIFSLHHVYLTRWSETGDVVFAEYLLANNELLSLQTYCRLLDGHSKAAASARTYLLGQSHLLQKYVISSTANLRACRFQSKI